MNNNQKNLLLNGVASLGAVLLIIACFCTYVSTSFLGYSVSTSLIKGGDGYFFMGLAVVTVVLVFINRNLIALITSVISIGLTFYEVVDTTSKLSEFNNFIDYGVGFYLMIIGVLVMAIAAIAKYILVKLNVL